MTAIMLRSRGSAAMPFLDHLEELRWRVIWSLVGLVIGVGAAFGVLLEVNVIGWLEGPILPLLDGRRLVFTHPGDPFQIVLQASVILGTLLALPVILYQLWAFVSPALHRHEGRRRFLLLGARSLRHALQSVTPPAHPRR